MRSSPIAAPLPWYLYRVGLVEVERKYLEAKAAVEKVTEKIEAEEDAAELAPEF